MQICSRCFYPASHPLFITFDENGLCSGCKIHEEKDEINWTERFEKLKKILDQYRSKSGKNYDCIIPVTGAQDSYFIVHVVKNLCGMNPLLVSYNKHYNTAAGIRNLANLRIKFDCDLLTLTLSPKKVKDITRSTLRRFGSIYWHCIAGHTVFPVQTSVKFKIPLIIWGVHQGIDQVGMFSHYDEVEMSRKYRKEHDLMCYEAEDLIDEFDEISEEDVVQLFYPDNKQIEMVGVRGIYLNNYLRWDSRLQHEEMIKLYSYETITQMKTFDFYNNIDCWNYNDVHDYVKYIKHGYGKVTDHVCREIRLKRMSWDYGRKLIIKYNAISPKHLQPFLSWIGMTENAFQYILDQHRNSIFWERDDNWDWKRALELENIASNWHKRCHNLSLEEGYKKFTLTDNAKISDYDDRYILIGKGFS